MWKAVGSVQDGDDKSARSNRSRMDIQAEPFHQGLKRGSTVSPEANRSFCQDYFDRHRNNTLNMTGYSNKSEKTLRGTGQREDMFTEIRNRASKVQINSKIDSLKDNPEGEEDSKTKVGVRKVAQRLHTLKRDQNKLKNSLQKEFDSFKNFFYQMEEQIHQVQEKVSEVSPEPSPLGEKIDEELLKGILSEAVDVERYFAEMDRKKAAIMQQLTG